jgi:hypothetical protein
MPSTCNNNCARGNALSCPPRRRSRRNRRKQRGGDNSGALIQLAPVSAATSGLYSPNGGNVQQQLQSEVHSALTNVFGPNKIQQFGGAKRKAHKGKTRKTKKRAHRRH